MSDIFRRSEWMRTSLLALACTFLFFFFYGAIPSALIAWTDKWKIILDNTQGAGIGPRIRDVAIVGYYGVITPLTFVLFSLYQRLHPVNADPDEIKRDAGGYR